MITDLVMLGLKILCRLLLMDVSTLDVLELSVRPSFQIILGY